MIFSIEGLLRRSQRDSCPIGVLPVGRTNSLAKEVFNYSNASSLKEVQSLADSAIAIVRGKTTKKDVIKIEPASEDNSKIKPIYALHSFHWGAFRDALTLRDKYWYTGPLREYFALLFNAFSDKVTWNCTAKVAYSLPCPGCSNCYVKPGATKQQQGRRWWSSLLSKQPANPSEPDFSRTKNERCNDQYELEIDASEIQVVNNLKRSNDEIPKLTLQVGKKEESAVDFIWDSWNRINSDQYIPKEVLELRSIDIKPMVVSTEEEEKFFSIDNEAYEVKPVKITVLPKAIDLYSL